MKCRLEATRLKSNQTPLKRSFDNNRHMERINYLIYNSDLHDSLSLKLHAKTYELYKKLVNIWKGDGGGGRKNSHNTDDSDKI